MNTLAALWRKIRWRLFGIRRTQTPEQLENQLRVLLDEGYAIVSLCCTRCGREHHAAVFPESLDRFSECDHCHHMTCTTLYVLALPT